MCSWRNVWCATKLSPVLAAETIITVVCVIALSSGCLVRLDDQSFRGLSKGGYPLHICAKRLVSCFAGWAFRPHAFKGNLFTINFKIGLKISSNVPSNVCLLLIYDGPEIEWPYYRGKGLRWALVSILAILVQTHLGFTLQQIRRQPFRCKISRYTKVSS